MPKLLIKTVGMAVLKKPLTPKETATIADTLDPPKMLKKPSELAENKSIEIDTIHAALNGNGIGCYCPECGAEQEFMINDWPINIPIICGAPLFEGGDCKCRFIIRNDADIVD